VRDVSFVNIKKKDQWKEKPLPSHQIKQYSEAKMYL